MARRSKVTLVLATVRRQRAGLLHGTALTAATLAVFVAQAAGPAAAQPAPNARPQGGQVVGGSANIGRTPSSTTITQSTQRAAIDWSSFDIGRQQSVQFVQPSNTALTLNRVIGPDPSQIAGQITANGGIIITNQSGVVFHQGAQVNAASLIVSAPGITNQNFMAGKLHFDQAPKPGATVSNAGTLTVGQAGLAALVAPRVVNSGTINAKLGRAVLAGAEAHTIDLYGDGLLSIDVTKQVRQAPVGPDGKPVTALVTNTGIVIADGGTVQITAAAADGIVQNLVEAGGTIQAHAAGGRVGRVAIAGVGGSVVVNGRVLADGGEVAVTASDTVSIAGSASVAAAGGTVAIGTSIARARAGRAAALASGPFVSPGTPAGTARQVEIAQGAVVSASGNAIGSGGTVVVLSTTRTHIAGSISARGGALGGDGGVVEESSAGGLAVEPGAVPDLGAAHGVGGTLLFDPYDLVIDQGAPPSTFYGYNSNTPNTPAASAPASGTSYISAGQLQTASRNGVTNIRLEAQDNITVQQAVDLSNSASSVSGGSAALSLTAGANLFVNADIKMGIAAGSGGGGNAALILDAGNQVVVAGGLHITSPTSITLESGGNMSLLGGATLLQSGGFLALTAGSPNPQTTNSYAPNPSTTGFVTVGSGVSLTGGVVTVKSASNGLILIDTGSSVSATSSSSSLLSSGTGGTSINGAISASPLTLVSTGDVTESASGVITTSDLSGYANSFALTSRANQITGIVTSRGSLSATGGDISINAGNGVSLTVGGGPSVTGGTISVTSLHKISIAADLLSVGAGYLYTGTLPNYYINSSIYAPSGTIAIGPSTPGRGVELLNGASSNDTLQVQQSSFSNMQANTLQLGSAASGPVTLGPSGATITLTGTFNQLDLISGASITGSNASVAVTTLTANAPGAVGLTSFSNAITNLGASSSSNNFSVANSSTLTIVGPVSTPGDLSLVASTFAFSGTGSLSSTFDVHLNTNGSVSPLSLPGFVPSNAPITTPLLLIGNSGAGPAIQIGSQFVAGSGVGMLGLYSAGSVSETVSGGSLGSITSAGLSGVAASATLNGTNLIGSLGSFRTTTGFALTNGQALTVNGPVNDGASIALNVTGTLTLLGNLTAPTVNLIGSGLITQAGGAISATSLTGSGDTVSLTSTLNSVANVGPFTAQTSFSLTDGVSLVVSGAIDPPVVTLNVAGDLSITAPVTGSLVTLNATGAITESGSGTVNAGTLTGTANSLALPALNTVGTLAGFTTQQGFTLLSGGTPTVSGPVRDGVGATIRGTAGLVIAGNITAPVVQLATGSGSMTGGNTLSQTAGTISASNQLNFAVDGDIRQTGGTISTGSLLGSSNGAATFASSGNAVGVLGPFTSQTGFSLVDGQALTVAGTVSDGRKIALNVTGALTLGANLAAPQVDLVASGAVSQTGGGIGAGVTGGTTLTGNVGSAVLNSSSNNIADLGNFTGSGDVSIGDGSVLTITGPVSVGSGHTLSVLADNDIQFQAGGSLSAPGGTVVLAPLSAGASLDLVGFSSSNSINASTLQIGSASAGDITISGSFNLPTVNTLDLVSGGSVSEGRNGGLIVSNLTGTAASALLGGNNQIGTLGAFTTTSGFTLVNGPSLAVAGPVRDGAAVNINVTNGDLTLQGSVTAPSIGLEASGAVGQTGGTLTATTLNVLASSVALGSAGNQVANLGHSGASSGFAFTDGRSLTVADSVSGGSASLTVAGDLALNGVVSGSPITLNVTGAVTEGANGGLSGGSLTGSVGSAVLTSQNLLGTLGNLTATSGVLTVVNGKALSVAGPVSGAGAVSLTSNGQLTLSGNVGGPSVSLTAQNGDLVQTTGTVSAGGGSSAGSVVLTANGSIQQTGGLISTALLSGASGGSTTLASANAVGTLGGFRSTGGFKLTDGQSLTVAGSVTDTSQIVFNVTGGLTLAGDLAAPLVNLVASGAVTQTAGGIGSSVGGGTTLLGTVGSATLGSSTNSFTKLGAFTGSGDVAITDGVTLNVTGAVAAGSTHTLSLVSDSIQIQTGGSLAAPNGIVALAPLSSGKPFALSNFVPAGSITASTLRVGSATAGPISIAGTFNLPNVGTLDLRSGAGVSEGGTGSLAVGQLTGTAASATLDGPNQIGTLGAFTTTSGFTLVNGPSLAVAGPVRDGAAVNINVTNGDLTLQGSVTAPSIGLEASGAVGQTGGTLTATTLNVLASSVALGSAGNQVANLGHSGASSGFAFTDGRSLTVADSVSGGSASLTVAGDLALNGVVSGSPITLNVTGAVTEGANGGLSGGSLTGSVGSAVLTSQNLLGTLGNLTATSGVLTVVNGKALSVAGPVSGAGAVSLTSNGQLTLSGNVGGPSVSLTAQNGDLVQTTGTVSAGGGSSAGSVVLTANGSIQQTGGLISTALLSGASGGSTTLASANAVGTLGGFRSTGGFKLTDGQSLTVAGSVTDTSQIVFNVTGGLTLAGDLAAPLVNLVASGAVTQTAGGIGSSVGGGTTLLGTVGSATLGSSTNSFTKLGAFTGSGDVAITDGVTLNVTGAVAAGSTHTLSLVSDSIQIQTGGSLAAPNGIVALAPLSSGKPFALSNFVPAGSITASTLRVGSATAGPISIAGTFNLPNVGTLDLRSGAGVSEGGTGSLAVGQLTGTAASATLDGPNQIGTLGAFTTTSGFTLVNGPSLAVAGPVRDGAAVNINVTNGDLTLQGSVTAPSIGLEASGAVGQTGGTLTATTLNVLASSVALGSAGNQVANLGHSGASSGFAFTDGRSLTVADSVSGGSASLTVAGDLALNGVVSGSPITLNVTGAVTEGANGGLSGGSLTGSVGSAVLTSQNLLGTLGNLTATSGVLTVVNGKALSVAGPVSGAGAVSLTSNGQLTLSGNVGGPSVSLTAQNGDLVQTAGTVSAGGGSSAGSVVLTANGSIQQTGGLISTALLSGASGGSTTLASANAVGTLGGFRSTGGFKLTDGQSLTVAGSVTDTSQIVFNVTGGLTLAGDLAAPLVNLVASGAVTQTAGGIGSSVGGGTTLLGTVGSATLGSSTNSFTKLGAFTGSGDVAITDGVTLNVTGAVAAGSTHTLSLVSDSIQIQTGGSLAAPNGIVALAPLSSGKPFALSNFVPAGSITASTLRVGSATAGPISIAGTFNLPNVGTLDLRSGAGVSEGGTGSLAVGQLTGTAASATLDGPNQIGTLGAFTTTSGFTLVNGPSLAVAGPVRDGAAVNINVTNGDLTLQGSVTAPALSLGATGLISQAGGSLTATTLSGSGGSVALTSATNQIANLGDFVSQTTRNIVNPGRFVFTDASPLALTGRLVGGAVALNVTGALTEGANGNVQATTLGGTAATVALGSVGNQIGTLTGLSASGDIAVTDGISLGVGAVTLGSGHTLALVSDGFQLQSGISVPGGTISLTPLHAGQTFALSSTGSAGSITADALNIGSATSGGITLDGTFNLQDVGLVAFASGAGISEGGTGRILASQVTAAASSATLNGANQIGRLGTFATSTGLQVTNLGDLVIADPLTDATLVSLSVTGNLTLQAAIGGPKGAAASPTVSLAATGAITEGMGGTVTASVLTGSATSATLSQAGNAITALGAFDSGGVFALADGVALNVTGPVIAGAGSTLTLASNSIQIQPGGSLAAAGETVPLAPFTSGTAFALGNFVPTGSITAGTLRVGSATTGDIAIAGTFNLPSVATLDLRSAGAITERGSGSVAVANLTGAARTARLDGPNQLGTLGAFTTTAGFSLTNTRSLAVVGPVQDATAIGLNVTGDLALQGGPTAPSLTLAATGAISQPRGALATPTLTGSAASAALNQRANQVQTLGAFATPGDFSLATTPDLTVSGPLSAASATLTGGGNIGLAGDITVNTLGVFPTGTVVQTGGTLTAGTLTGTAIALAQFGTQGKAAVSNLGSMILTGSSLVLVDTVPLTVAGPLVSSNITLSAPNVVTLQGGQITTRNGAISVTGTGAQLVQTGTTTVTAATGTGSGNGTLSLSLPASGGTMSFSNLDASSENVVLNLGSGTATGTLTAANLQVNGTGGGATLFGSVAGRTGFSAAQAAAIAPLSNPAYQLNRCTIASTCGVIIPSDDEVFLQVGLTELAPKSFLDTALGGILRLNLFTIDLITIGVARETNNPDLVLPNISDRDY